MSRKSLIILAPAIFVLAVMLTITSCSSDDSPTGSGGGNPPANTVFMQGSSFSPKPLTVAAGTEVTWTNKDGVAHNVTSTGSPSFTSSGTLTNNQSYKFTFTTAGTYTYTCTLHPGMNGSIVVTP